MCSLDASDEPSSGPRLGRLFNHADDEMECNARIISENELYHPIHKLTHMQHCMYVSCVGSRQERSTTCDVSEKKACAHKRKANTAAGEFAKRQMLDLWWSCILQAYIYSDQHHESPTPEFHVLLLLLLLSLFVQCNTEQNKNHKIKVQCIVVVTSLLLGLHSVSRGDHSRFEPQLTSLERLHIKWSLCCRISSCCSYYLQACAKDQALTTNLVPI